MKTPSKLKPVVDPTTLSRVVIASVRSCSRGDGPLGRRGLNLTVTPLGTVTAHLPTDPTEMAGPDAEPQVAVDWWNDRLQFLLYDGRSDDCAVHFRLHPDGSLAEILVRDDLWKFVRIESAEESPWQHERDHH